MKQTRSCCGRGSCRSPCTTFLFSFQNISFGGKEEGSLETKFGTHSLLLEEHYYFTWSKPDHDVEEGHVGVLVQPLFFFLKNSFRGKEEGLLFASTEHGPKTTAAKSSASNHGHLNRVKGKLTH